MSTGIVGGDRFHQKVQLTYSFEHKSAGTLMEDKINIVRVTGVFYFPTPKNTGGWVRFIVPTNLDLKSNALAFKGHNGTKVKHVDVLYDDLQLLSSMQGKEIFAFVNEDNIWEVL